MQACIERNSAGIITLIAFIKYIACFVEKERAQLIEHGGPLP